MPTVQQYNRRRSALQTERSPFLSLWGELSDYHLAHRGRYLVQGGNGRPRYTKNTRQINNASRIASRVLGAGMMAGLTSPARPWFKLTVADRELAEEAAVIVWLEEVQKIIYSVFSRSNVYNALHTVYGDLGVMGGGVMGVFEDPKTAIWTQVYQPGSYYLAANEKDEIDTFYRDYSLPVKSVVEKFGEDRVSPNVKRLYDRGQLDTLVDLIQVIEPNAERRIGSPLAKDMPFRSVHYEKGRVTETGNVFLLESGFRMFPILTPRWEVLTGDVYATDCPGMTAIGDTKSLQLGERRMYQALDKVSDPPLQAPSSMRAKLGETIRHGQVVYTDAGEVKSIYGSYRPDLNAIVGVNDRAIERIDTAFYKDLFLMLASTDRREITAREVQEKHEEKLLMLGPVLERLQFELLNPLIDRTFDILQEHQLLPPPPEEIQGEELDVVYVSVLAQAQQLATTGAIERVAGFAGNLTAIWPEARHKIDPLQAIDEYSRSIGAPVEMVRSDQDTEDLVQAEREAQQNQQILDQAQQLAATAGSVAPSGSGGSVAPPAGAGVEEVAQELGIR